MTDRHENHELAIFRLFASVCGLPIEFDSIEKRQPEDKEPDILCNLTGEGPLAFELVRMVDKDRIAKPDSDAEELIKHIENGHRKLPNEARAEFNRRFGNAWVRIKMRPSLTLRRRKKIVDGILDHMMKLDSDFAGTFPMFEKKIEVASVQVKRRDSTAGPRFTMPTTSFYSPIPLGAIEEKFNKTYLISAPIELLAYYDKQSAPPEEQLRELLGYIESRLRKSCFRRVWVFNTSDCRVCFSVGDHLAKSRTPESGSSLVSNKTPDQLHGIAFRREHRPLEDPACLERGDQGRQNRTERNHSVSRHDRAGERRLRGE